MIERLFEMGLSTPIRVIMLILLLPALAGCLAAAAGAGAEAGYLAAQEDRSVGETIDDQAIVSSIKTRLLADSEVSGLDINVDSFKGEVTLTGVVKSEYEAERAEKIAWKVSGVKAVNAKLYLE